MYDLVKSTRRVKHKILNESIPIDVDDDKGEYKELDYLLKDETENPEQLLLNDEGKKELQNIINSKLNDIEIQVLELKLKGFENKEISEILDCDYKKIDNTLQRIKQKLKETKKCS